MGHIHIVREQPQLHMDFKRAMDDGTWEATYSYEGGFANKNLGPLYPSLCPVDFKKAFGEVSGDTIHCILSDRPIPREDWVPISLRTAHYDSLSWHGSRLLAGSVYWQMGHVEYPNYTLDWHMEQALLCWLPEVQGVHHLCVAIYEEVSE